MTLFRNALLASLLAMVPGCLDLPEWHDPPRDAGSSQKYDAEKKEDAYRPTDTYHAVDGERDAGNPPEYDAEKKEDAHQQEDINNREDVLLDTGQEERDVRTLEDVVNDARILLFDSQGADVYDAGPVDTGRLDTGVLPECIITGNPEPFYTGSIETVGRGECTIGERLCVDHNGRPAYIVTKPEVTPQPERCDGKDNSCDGQTDEGYDVGAMCERGIGACHSEGTKECTVDGLETRCNAPVIDPREEQCNGEDDDCDGETDGGICENLVGYVCGANGNKDVCVIQFDGQAKINLTNREGDDWNGEYADPVLGGRYRPSPSFSPDGRRLAYVAEQNQTIHIKNVLTGEEEVLPGTEGARLVSFSPDGTKIAFARDCGMVCGREAVIYDLQNQREEWRGDGYTPSWGPDGTLVFGGARIFLRAPNGETREFLDAGGFMPTISPDGTGVLYAGADNQWRGIDYIDLINGQRRREADGARISPIWMSNGADYLFSVLNGEIHKRRLGEQGEQNLATGEMPALSSDNQWMVYVSSQHGTKDLFIKSLDGLVERRLTDDPGDEESPAFAPVRR